MEIKLLLEEDIEKVWDFEISRIDSSLSEIQLEMESWDKPWRKESLSHYSQLGWSFVAVGNSGEIKGYCLGQPILFFNNWTQTLWIEGLSFADPEVGFQLMDTAIRWSKTKHLQKVIVNKNVETAGFVLEKFPKFSENGYLHLSTTKLSEG